MQKYIMNYFSTRFTHDKKRDKIWKQISKYLSKYVYYGDTVLDVGAGYCDYINNVQCIKKYAIDICPTTKEYADKDVNVITGSFLTHNFGKTKFNVIMMSNFLEHFNREDGLKILQKTHSLLCKGGYLIMIQPNYKYCCKEYFDDYTHITPYSDVGLTDLLNSLTYEVIRITPRFLPFSMKSHLPKWSWLTWTYLRLPIRPLAKQMLCVTKKW